MFLLTCQQTSENLVLDFAQQIQNKLPIDNQFYKLILSETVMSFAEWYIEVN